MGQCPLIRAQDRRVWAKHPRAQGLRHRCPLRLPGWMPPSNTFQKAFFGGSGMRCDFLFPL